MGQGRVDQILEHVPDILAILIFPARRLLDLTYLDTIVHVRGCTGTMGQRNINLLRLHARTCRPPAGNDTVSISAWRGGACAPPSAL